MVIVFTICFYKFNNKIHFFTSPNSQYRIKSLSVLKKNYFFQSQKEQL